MVEITYNDDAIDSPCGEFIRPNKIIIYTKKCQEVKRNIKNVIVHEYVHYLIFKIKPLEWLFNNLTRTL